MKESRNHFEETVRFSPFHTRTAPLNVVNAWHRWSDYSIPTLYDDVAREYAAIRNACSVFDLSPMHKYRVSGKDAVEFLNRLITREVASIGVGRVGYCVWCNDSGHVIEDGTLFHVRSGHYWLFAQEEQWDWLSRCADGVDVRLEDATHRMAALSLQGPTSAAVLRRFGLASIDTLRPFHLATSDFEGSELLVSRTGFTGDLGYELWIQREAAEALWDAIFTAGRAFGTKPIGSHALDIARIEAGFVQSGVDYLPGNAVVRSDRGRTPEELGLGFLVDFDKDHFNGKSALLRERERGSRYQLLRLDVEGNKPATDALILNRWGRTVGAVTSAIWSPSAKASIAIASVRRPHGRAKLRADIYYRRELQWSRVKERVRVRRGRFFDPPRRKQTPPADF